MVYGLHHKLLDLILQFSTFLHRKQSSQQLQMKTKHWFMLKQWAVSENQNSKSLITDSDFIWFLSDCSERAFW